MLDVLWLAGGNLFQVNEMRDNATQMEDEIDRIQQSISQGRAELNQLKIQMLNMDTQTPSYVSACLPPM